MSKNFRKIGSGILKLLPIFSLHDPTDKNTLGQFDWFSRVGSHMHNSKSILIPIHILTYTRVR